MSSAALRHTLLLDMLSSIRVVDKAAVTELDASDWEAIKATVKSHRIAPLLHWQLLHHHADLTIPPDFKAYLEASYKQSTLRALELQRELTLVHRILEQAGIPYLALKGSFLAYHSYPKAALRPLRDLDLLIHKSRVLDAYQAALDGGLKRVAEYPGDPLSFMTLSQHLPPLRSASERANVEIHAQLLNPNMIALDQPDALEETLLWERSITRTMGTETLRFLSPTDLLLHLIVHAVDHHQFDNGPLILSDIAWLLQSEPIDWPGFWKSAAAGDWLKSCVLAFKMTERYWGPQPIQWHEAAPLNDPSLPAIVESASLLMLRDYESRGDTRLTQMLTDKVSLSERLRFIAQKIFPSRVSISALYGKKADSPFIYFDYPRKWWSLLSSRLPHMLNVQNSPDSQAETTRLSQVQHWIHGSHKPHHHHH